MPWIFLGLAAWLLSETGESANIITGRYKHDRPMPRPQDSQPPPYTAVDRLWL